MLHRGYTEAGRPGYFGLCAPRLFRFVCAPAISIRDAPAISSLYRLLYVYVILRHLESGESIFGLKMSITALVTFYLSCITDYLEILCIAPLILNCNSIRAQGPGSQIIGSATW